MTIDVAKERLYLAVFDSKVSNPCPKGFVDHTLSQRSALGLPPFSAMAELSGEGVDRVEAALRADMLVEVARVEDDRLLVRAQSDGQLDESLRAAGVTAGGDLRVARDPLRA